MTIAAPGFADRTSAVPGIGAGADAPDRGAGDAEVIGGELGAGGTKLALPATRDGAAAARCGLTTGITVALRVWRARFFTVTVITAAMSSSAKSTSVSTCQSLWST